MSRPHLIVAAVVVAGALGALLWSVGGPSPTPTTRTKGKSAGEPRAKSLKKGLVDVNPFKTSRPATARDVPRSGEEAEARPEAKRNRAMATIRQDFAAKRYTAVIQKARETLNKYPDMESARAFLAMSACAVGDKKVATKEWEQLPDARQKFVENRCESFGISLP